MNIVFGVLIGVCAGAVLVYWKLSPRLKETQKLDQATMDKNIWLQEENIKLQSEMAALTARKDELSASIESLQQQSEQAAEAIYQAHMRTMEEAFANSAEKLSHEYQSEEERYQREYLTLLSEAVQEYNESINIKKEELAQVSSRLADLRAIYDASVEANKRAQELKEQENFYKLNLPQTDLIEIEKLREVTQFLRDSEPLNKVIWKVYYEKAYTDLIGRVIGSGVHTGIYKITNLTNGMCYVGQAVNIADRWRQHIKRGIGADTPTRNKLYPAMLEYGVENFSFEIIEECSRDLLNDREIFWQEYFKAKEFGYSIK